MDYIHLGGKHVLQPLFEHRQRQQRYRRAELQDQIDVAVLPEVTAGARTEKAGFGYMEFRSRQRDGVFDCIDCRCLSPAALSP